MKKVVVSALVIAAFLSFAWVLINKFEGTLPSVDIKLPSQYLKKSYEMSVNIADQKTGLKKIVISIMQTGKENVLLEKEYQAPGISGIFSDIQTKKDTFLVPIQSWKYGMIDGEAVIRVMVSDFSWRGWGKGNIFYAEKKVIIDSKPPKVNILTKRHNIERGGSGLIIYKVFEKNIKSGVKVGDNYFPGFSGMFDDQSIYAVFFALNHLQGRDTQISVVAEDAAGNTTKRGFYHYIRDKRFKNDVLNISDRFLERKIPDFEISASAENDIQNKKNPLLEKFLYINGEIRKQNVSTILSSPWVTENKLLWSGRFLRLKGSVRRSGFADRRVYKYKGQEIDKAVHLGVDLASTSNAPVKAANSGRVIFSALEGIFGNTVIIDHGFGLRSLYAHLSQISVDENQLIEKGQDIGTTGLTGLAGGDHLHFSMIVNNVFVNPIEWWDNTWIKNNITSKIEDIRKIPNG